MGEGEASLSPAARRAAMSVLAVVLVCATILMAASSEAGLGGAALAEQVCSLSSQFGQEMRTQALLWRLEATSGGLRAGVQARTLFCRRTWQRGCPRLALPFSLAAALAEPAWGAAAHTSANPTP